MFEVKLNNKRNRPGTHFVIISDEAGIFDAFNFITDRLADRGTAILSFIYTFSENNLQPLFERELNILERRYSGRLIVHMVRTDTNQYCCKQDIIEATINSNTLPKIEFLVFGNIEFINYLFGILQFLDVKAPMIKSKIA